MKTFEVCLKIRLNIEAESEREIRSSIVPNIVVQDTFSGEEYSFDDPLESKGISIEAEITKI